MAGLLPHFVPFVRPHAEARLIPRHVQKVLGGEQCTCGYYERGESTRTRNFFIKAPSPGRRFVCPPAPPRPAPLPLSPPRPVGASTRAKKKSPPPLPSSFHGEDLEVCLLALILRARLAVTQACSRHDSHCGVCSLCLRDKAASVVSPASCFKHHMVALWRSPSSRPPLFLHLSYFPPSVSFSP